MDLINEALRAVRAGRPSAMRVSESGAWGMRLPGIEGMGFHVVLRGSGWLISTTGSPTRIHTGDVILVPYGTEHGLSHRATRAIASLPELTGPVAPRAEPAEFEVVLGCYRLDHTKVHRSLRRLPSVIAMSPDYERNPELRAVIGMLTSDVSGSLPGAEATQPALIDLMLIHALRQQQEATAPGEWPASAEPGIDASLEAIHTNPQSPWTVPQLAEIAGMSRTTFTRHFTSVIGQPPIAYLIEWRLVHGARLLHETKEPLAVIARQVGYSTEFAFANAFRRKYGIAPGRFRRHYVQRAS